MKPVHFIAFGILFLSFPKCLVAEYSEVLDQPSEEIYIQDLKATKQPLVTVSDSTKAGSRYAFLKNPQKVSRPDYQMLDYQKKSGEIPYDGPVSDRKKVYYFAAGMAASGVLAGTMIPVSAVSAGSGAGAGAFAAGGAAVTAGTLGMSTWKSKPDSGGENFSHTHEAVLKRLANK